MTTPLLLAALLAAPVAADWPQYRGDGRDGVADGETGLARSWEESPPRELWRQPIGPAFSGIAVVGDRLYTGDSDDAKEYVVALDRESGEEIWRSGLGPLFTEEFGNGPRATPTVSDGTVYALGSHGHLLALDAATGEVRWRHDLKTEMAAEQPLRGYSGSPLVDGGKVILEAGGSDGRAVIALDAASGELLWSAGEGAASYSSPLAVTIDGVRQYVLVRRVGEEGPEVLSLTEDGEVYWTFPAHPAIIVPPIFVPPDRLWVSTAEDWGGKMLRVRDDDGSGVVEEDWASIRFKNHFNPALLLGEHLYGFDNAILKCIATADGTMAWATRGYGKGSLIAADGLLFLLTDRGALAVAEASPEGFEESGRIQAMEGKAWTMPALADGRIYLRDQDEIVAYDVRAAGAAAAGEASP